MLLHQIYHIFARCLAAVLVLLTSAVSTAQAQPNQHDRMADLRGRYPLVVQSDGFRSWIDGKTLGPWHESRTDAAGQRTVVIQNAAGDKLFAALVAPGEVIRFAPVDLVPLQITRAEVLALTATQLRESRIHAVRPNVTFDTKDTPTIQWEVEVLGPRAITTYRLRAKALDSIATRAVPRPFEAGTTRIRSVADDMADNEMHHLAAFALEARPWVAGATSVQDKARRIFDWVDSTYRYDDTIQHISEFTWADDLVRGANGRRGICDEFAVVQISYLRSVGIPARLKFLTWQVGSEGAAHAAVEYSDGGTWRHMDALWHAFNDPGIYRRNGATQVTVMDADHPSDVRSTTPAWGVPDRTGDGKLYPYGDFIIAPAYPGNRRSGYSF